VEPSSWTQAGAVSGNLLVVHSACLILPGSKSTDNDHQGFQGTWEPPTSPSTFRTRSPEPQISWPPVGRPPPRGANDGRNDGIGSW